MKLISWNVNGIRACDKKGFKEFFLAQDADIFCLQETKLSEGQYSFEPEGYTSYFNYAEKKGYSGTAIFTKIKPVNVTFGIGHELDNEGRTVIAEYDKFFLICVYTPNSQDELKRLPVRMDWDEAFRRKLQELEQIKPVIFTGDLNVAHEEIDIKNAKTNHMSAGFSDEERESFTKTLSLGYIDSFRYLYPDTIKYSWFSYRFKARERNTGWRIDYFGVSEKLKNNIKDASIIDSEYGSDHLPITLELCNL